MKKLLSSIICLFLITGLFSVSVFADEINVSAGEKYQANLAAIGAGPGGEYVSSNSYGDRLYFGNKTFYTEYQSEGHYKICMVRNGVTKVIVSNAAIAYVTNGKYLFYAEVGAALSGSSYYKRFKQIIYCINTDTGKKKRIAAGSGLTPFACSGDWLYAGIDTSQECRSYKVYAYNVKTGAKQFMMDDARSIQYVSGVVMGQTARSDVSNANYYLFNKNGTGKKLLAKALDVKIQKRYIYYVVYKNVNYTMYYKVYRVNLKGKNKKALTGWTITNKLWDYAGT